MTFLDTFNYLIGHLELILLEIVKFDLRSEAKIVIFQLVNFDCFFKVKNDFFRNF